MNERTPETPINQNIKCRQDNKRRVENAVLLAYTPVSHTYTDTELLIYPRLISAYQWYV
jgi:hypothetical protein